MTATKYSLFLLLLMSPIACLSQVRTCKFPDPIPFCIFPKERTLSKVFGRVSDGNGALVPEACVSLFDKQKNRVASTFTDQKGRFSLKRLPKGRYVLVVDYPGLSSAIAPVKIDKARGTSKSLKVRMANLGIDTCGTIEN